MSRIQAIQNALVSINETVFQDLCDSFIYKTIDPHLLFSRTGSQVGKKTPEVLMILLMMLEVYLKLLELLLLALKEKLIEILYNP